MNPAVKLHSISAVSGNKPLEEDDDGVVAYPSAHIMEAVSEKVIQSGHSVQGHPEAIEEIRRILLDHSRAEGSPQGTLIRPLNRSWGGYSNGDILHFAKPGGTGTPF